MKKKAIYTMICGLLLAVAASLQQTPAEDVVTPASLSQPPLPKVESYGKLMDPSLAYPDEAVRLRSQGRVLLAFNIDNRGGASEIVVERIEGSGLWPTWRSSKVRACTSNEESACAMLANNALAILKAMKFEAVGVTASGVAENNRYRMSVVMELEPCQRIKHFDVPMDSQIEACRQGVP